MKRKSVKGALEEQRECGRAVLSVLVPQQMEDQDRHKKYIMTYGLKNVVDAKNVIEELRILVTYLEQARKEDAELALSSTEGLRTTYSF